MQRVTAIVASYNHERWIEESLRSILDQTIPIDRIIFFSDGSRDRTLEIAKATFGSDRRVEFLEALDENHGLIPRLIEAFARVEDDDIVIICSGDDAWERRRVEIHLEHFRDPSCEWSIGATQVCDAQLLPVAERCDPVETMRRWGKPGDYFGAILADWPALPPHGWAFRQRLYRRVGGIDPRYAFEDFPLLNFARAASPRLTREVVYRYRALDSGWCRAGAPGVAAEFARVTLAQWRHRPLLALKHAGRRYAQAAALALASRRPRDAMRLFACAIACWPSPIRPFRALFSALLRRIRSAHA